MPKIDSFHKSQIKIQLTELFEKTKAKDKCGIGFNLNIDESPLNILGVLDFLKYKIKKWRNTNIFTYQGKLFGESMILVVGSNNLEEAKDIALFIFLNEILNKKKDLYGVISDLNSDLNLEQYLNDEIFINLVIGFPKDPHLEKQLKNHLKILLTD